MLKKACARCFTGFASGILAGQIVAIMISLSLGDGEFYQVMPEFRALFRDEVGAVIVQTFLTGLIGAVFATTSLVFELDTWTLLRQYVVHFLITASFWVPIVYLCWMPQNTKGILIFFLNFIGTYLIIWVTQYFVTKNDIRKINAIIRAENNQQEDE